VVFISLGASEKTNLVTVVLSVDGGEAFVCVEIYFANQLNGEKITSLI
jgi:hypothetical protein